MIEARKTNVILCFTGKQGTATGTTEKQVEFPTDEPSATTKNVSELIEKVVSVMGSAPNGPLPETSCGEC